jgi:hypothetical protein
LETRLGQTSIRSCIHFRTQEKNQSRALSSSFDGGYATVDLSSASDRLSCWAVERCFRTNWSLLQRLHACRTRWLSNEVSTRFERYLLLKKFAPMGSAVTFPVQSIFYACVAVACVLFEQKRKVSDRSIESVASQVLVFGDDIIIPKSTLSVLVLVLDHLGLKVNVDKTFGIGKFRESCGVDAYGGYDVTPSYLTSPSTRVRPSEVGSFIHVSNNMWKKGRWHTAKWLESLLQPYLNKIPVVDIHSGFPGLASYCGSKIDHLRSRWNASLHRYEVNVLVPRERSELRSAPGTCSLFQWFIENPAPDTRWVAGVRGRSTSTWRSGWAPVDNIKKAA